MNHTPKYLIENKNKYPNEPALSEKIDGVWSTLTWSEFYELVRSISKSFISFGIDKNDKISIYSYNRIEWNACYLATQLTNSVAVGVYHTSSSEEVEWVVGNSDSKIIFVGNNPNDNDENDRMPIHRLNKVLKNLDKLEAVVIMDDTPTIDHDKVITWREFLNKGKDIDEKQVLERADNIDLDDTSSIIYTSGTTGNPSVWKRVRIFEFMGAAPDMANFKFPNPAADLSFFFNNSETNGILRPILKTALDSIAETKLEYTFSYILGTEQKRCGWTSLATSIVLSGLSDI